MKESYEPKISVEEFVERLNPLLERNVKHRSPPLESPRNDVLVDLLSQYNFDEVDFIFFRFHREGVSSVGNGVRAISASESYIQHYLEEENHKIFSYHPHEMSPKDTGMESDEFLIDLLEKFERLHQQKAGQ